MSRHFNTAGPNNPADHYTLPVLERLPQIGPMFAAKSWFVLHAPRQSGKTTLLRTLARELTESGKYAALHASCETGSPYPDDPAAASRAIVGDMVMNATIHLPPQLRPPPPDRAAGDERMISGYLQVWAATCPLPTVLLLDEIDSLQDATLLSVLRQLRSLYLNRPDNAPSSVALVGVRDVRDYKVKIEPSGRVGSDSPFNVTVKSLTLKAFTRAEIATLYGQHTAETGQAFTGQAIDLVHAYTQGQPWLVNALAWHVITELAVTDTITDQHVMRAKEEMILSRTTHLQSLAKLLRDPRVRAVMGPILTGQELPLELPREDLDFCVDLGLVAPDLKPIRVANPIYREVLPRELAYPLTVRIAPTERKWSLADGRLDMAGLLDAFVDFWRQHGEWMVVGQEWPEAAHQIVLMAWLHRVINGGGYIEREYGLGRGRLDLLVRWFTGVDATGLPTGEDRHALELKVWRKGQADPTAAGLVQLDGYLDRLGLATGVLVVFDARPSGPKGKNWRKRGQLGERVTPGGRTVTVLGV